MSRNSSTKFYQEHIERLQKKAHEIYQSLSEEEKKSDNMVVKDSKIFQKMKNKVLFSIEKKIIK